MKTAPQGGDINFIEGKGLLYTLNGLGPKGSVRGGKPSSERHLLLRREALELAFYTFRYIDDVDLVVALLPPVTVTARGSKPGKKGAAAPRDRGEAGQALFFRPGDLKPQLEIPLGATMPPRDPEPGDDCRPPRPAASRRSRAGTCSASPSSRGRTRRPTSCWTGYRE